jgi:hypothetical protein
VFLGRTRHLKLGQAAIATKGHVDGNELSGSPNPISGVVGEGQGRFLETQEGRSSECMLAELWIQKIAQLSTAEAAPDPQFLKIAHGLRARYLSDCTAP